MSVLKSSTPLSAKVAFAALFTITFFLSAQVSLTIYIDSSFLTHAVKETPSLSNMQIWEDPEDMVGAIYTLSSLLTLLLLLVAPRILCTVGNFRWTLGLLLVHIAVLIGLGMSSSAWFIIPLFVVEAALISTLYFSLDVFLEHYSRDESTGFIRGTFITIGSIAWVLPPLFAGQIVENYGFSLVYLSAAALVLPTIFLMMRFFNTFEDMKCDTTPLLISRADAAKHPDIGRILWTAFLMHCFYATMLIYMPLYLHEHIGFSYGDIGLIFTLALSAFVFIPYPAGIIADRWLGEKELLVAGFLLMAATTAFLPSLAVAGAGLFAWAGVLFLGRIGAATVETMAETYFFKQIDGHNAGLMGYFRRCRPLAFLAAPIAASLLLSYDVLEISGLFYALAALMVVAIYFPLRLKDTL